ncbi:MAG: tandem-95 repeat protein [Planctomycetes bacterium]|nr:tandem-95 repeat protein [Planctomycetota bacterium]
MRNPTNILCLAVLLLPGVRLPAASFIRGDVDGNGNLQITDAILTLGYLFLGSSRPEACLDAADFDDSGVLNITDPIASLGFQFLGGPGPRLPFPDCGRDATPDLLDCREFELCPESTGVLGGPGDDAAADVAAASDGGLLVAGSFEGSWTIGAGQAREELLESAGESDVFLARLDAAGDLVWASRAGGLGQDEARKLALLSGGDAVAGGVFTGAAVFGALEERQTLLDAGADGDRNVFVARFSGLTGRLVWAQQLGGAGQDGLAGLGIGPDGGVYAAANLGEAAGAGGTEGGGTEGGGAAAAPPGAAQAIVARYASGGSIAWLRTLSGAGRFRAGALAVLSTGEVLAAGSFAGSVSLSAPGRDPVVLAGAAGSQSLFLARLGPDGAVRGLERLGSATAIDAHALAAGPGGGFALGGAASGNAVLGPAAGTQVALQGLQARDGFVAAFGPDRSLLWAAVAGGPLDDAVHALAARAEGGVHAAGASSGPVRLDGARGDPLSVEGAGGDDAFIATLSAAGAPASLARRGGPGADQASGLDLAADGSLLVAGSFTGSAAFSGGGEPLSGLGGSDGFAVRVAAEPNRLPAPADDVASVPEGGQVLIDVLANDRDPDLDALRVAAVTRPVHGVAEAQAGGKVLYAPEPGFSGQDSFRYTVDDGRGGTASAGVEVTVQPVNDPPVPRDDTASTLEGQPVTIEVLRNDLDPDGDALSVASVTAPASGTAVRNAGGTVTYTPRAGFNGVDSFRYTASDGKGGTASAQVRVAVNPVNDPPVARGDAATTPEDTPVEVNVTANDSDPEGEALAVLSVEGVPNGSASVVGTGRVRYTPGLDLHGVFSFRYAVGDPRGGTASAEVTVTVTPVEDPPRAAPDFASTTEDTAVTIPVLANDRDPEGDALTLVSVTAPQHGTAVAAGNQARYTPAADFSGTDSFTYTVRDAKNGTATGSVTVTVGAVNDAPAAAADASTSSEDRVVVIDVLANDADPDGDPLRVVAATQGQHGSVTVTGDGKVIYVPRADFSGTDSFTYTVDDGKGGVRTVTVNVTVQAFSDPPGAAEALDPDRFVPLDGSGRPLEGETVTAAAAGTIGPFEYRPSGRSLFGLGTGLGLRFPQGARRVRGAVQGTFFLELTQCSAAFGPGFPLQLNPPLSRGGTVKAAVPIGAVDPRDLAVLFGKDPEQGIPVLAYGRFPLRWRGGRLDEDGIRRGRFTLDMPRFPVPELSGLYEGFTLDLNRRDGIRIPISGRFELPDGTPTPFALSADPANPLWIGLTPSGDIQVTGRALARFPNGVELSVDVALDDPGYALRIGAVNSAASFTEILIGLLPGPASRCFPGGSTQAESDQAALCLRRLERACRLAAASAAGAAPADDRAPPETPVDPEDLAAAPLEAWSELVLTGLVTALPLDQLQTLFGLYARSASASSSLDTVATYLLALERARQAIAAKLSNPSAARASADAAVTEAEAAARRALLEPASVASIASFRESLGRLREVLSIRLGLSLARPAYLADAPKLLDAFLAGHARSLGVAAGVFSPSGNAKVEALDRAAALDGLKALLGALGDARTLAIDGNVQAPARETAGQLALRLHEAAEADLDAAEAKGDAMGFAAALADIVELVALRALAVFPSDPALSGLPGTAQLPGYASRLDALLTAGLARAPGERSVNNFSGEVRMLLAILKAMPVQVSFASQPFRRVYDRMTTALRLATDAAQLAGRNTLELADLVKAGLLHAALGERFGFTPAEVFDWEGDALPRLIARLCDASRTARHRSGLSRAIEAVLADAARLRSAGNEASRRARLGKADDLIDCLREVAVLAWDDGEPLRDASPLLQGADMVLPGGIRVREAMGEVRYNRSSGAVSGAFAGSLLFPGFDLALRIQRASFSSGGSFELAADGELGFPGGTLEVPARRPLHLRLRPGEGLDLSGGRASTSRAASPSARASRSTIRSTPSASRRAG